jgi:hypothetical protein
VEQGLVIVSMLRVDGYPNAEGDGGAGPRQQEGMGQLLEQTLGRVERSFCAAVGQEQGKLVSPPASDGIRRPDAARQPLADLLQEQIAGGIAPVIVDLLEAIEIQEQDGAGGLVPLGRPDGLLEPITEEAAIGQLCEGGTERLLGERRLGAVPGDLQASHQQTEEQEHQEVEEFLLGSDAWGAAGRT